MAGPGDTRPTPQTTGVGRAGPCSPVPATGIDAWATALEAMTALAGTYDAHPVD